MKLYLASLGAGILVGVLYALMGVRSPAPPVIALLGLLGMLVGEQIPGAVRQALNGHWPTWTFAAAAKDLPMGAAPARPSSAPDGEGQRDGPPAGAP